MNRFRTTTVSLLCLGFAAMASSSALAHPTDSAPSMKSTSELKWTDLRSLPPGAQFTVLEGPMNKAVTYTARIRMPANYRLPAHWHSGIERLTVLSGTLHVGSGKKLDVGQGTALKPGDFAVIPAGSPHFAYTTGEPVEIQLHGMGPAGTTYVNAADDPRQP